MNFDTVFFSSFVASRMGLMSKNMPIFCSMKNVEIEVWMLYIAGYAVETAGKNCLKSGLFRPKKLVFASETGRLAMLSGSFGNRKWPSYG